MKQQAIDYINNKIEKYSKMVEISKKVYEGNESKFTFHGGQSYGYEQGKLSAYENMKDELQALPENNSQAIDMLDQMIKEANKNHNNRHHTDTMGMYFDDCESNILSLAESRIQALGDGWIPVKERLPDTSVLALGFQGEYHIGYIAKYENDGGYFCEGEDTILDDVTHWMPLPLPPN